MEETCERYIVAFGVALGPSHTGLTFNLHRYVTINSTCSGKFRTVCPSHMIPRMVARLSVSKKALKVVDLDFSLLGDET